MRKYKCQYKHCTHPQDLITQDEAVLIGTKRYHKNCAEIRNTLERAKRVFFDNVKPDSDYVQTVGVLNNLVFKKGYSADYIEFMLMWLALRGAKVNSPYSLHYAVNNNLILRDYKDDSKRQDVINRYAYRFG